MAAGLLALAESMDIANLFRVRRDAAPPSLSMLNNGFQELQQFLHKEPSARDLKEFSVLNSALNYSSERVKGWTIDGAGAVWRPTAVGLMRVLATEDATALIYAAAVHVYVVKCHTGGERDGEVDHRLFTPQ